MVENVTNINHRLIDSVTKLNVLSDNIYKPSLEILNEVKIQKSSLVNTNKLKKENKGKRVKKKVRFEDSESGPKRITIKERIVQFFYYIWTCTRTTVEIVLRKSWLFMYFFF